MHSVAVKNNTLVHQNIAAQCSCFQCSSQKSQHCTEFNWKNFCTHKLTPINFKNYLETNSCQMFWCCSFWYLKTLHPSITLVCWVYVLFANRFFVDRRPEHTCTSGEIPSDEPLVSHTPFCCFWCMFDSTARQKYRFFFRTVGSLSPEAAEECTNGKLQFAHLTKPFLYAKIKAFSNGAL